MKFLFDLLPVIFFFGTFKFAEKSPAAAESFAGAVMGSDVPAAIVPVLLATAVAIAATVCQILWIKLRGNKVEPMLWISFAVICVFGGLTLWLRNEMFIKWKPTILYWIFASILLWASLTGRNFIKTLMEKAQIEMSNRAWGTLQYMWIGFFAVTGTLNLLVAYLFPTEIWVDFKLFGLMALTLLFTIGAGLYMARHATPGKNQ